MDKKIITRNIIISGEPILLGLCLDLRLRARHSTRVRLAVLQAKVAAVNVAQTQPA